MCGSEVAPRQVFLAPRASLLSSPAGAWDFRRFCCNELALGPDAVTGRLSSLRLASADMSVTDFVRTEAVVH